MLFQIIEENGVKKIQALTADTGTGAPVGSYLYLEKKSNPQGYLYCDGSTFDETVYPALYQYLGTNVLPDWREFSAVGAEQNTTSSVIATHDVFTQGEEKDDQLQDHSHRYFVGGSFGSTAGIAILSTTSQGEDSIDQTGRHGTVTRGKSRAVFIYIKATSGLTENQQENVLNTINENNSYSTEEHPTGKKWIDGKPIYRKVVAFGALPNSTHKSINHNISNIDFIVKVEGVTTDGTYYFEIPRAGIPNAYMVDLYTTKTEITMETSTDYSAYTTTYVTLEYTKTTD